MTEAEFHDIYGSEVAGNHDVLGILPDGSGLLCRWTADDGTTFYFIALEDMEFRGEFLTRAEMKAALAICL